MFTDVGKSSGGPASSPESDTNRACIVSGTITSSTSTFTRLNLFTLMMNAIYQKQKKTTRRSFCYLEYTRAMNRQELSVSIASGEYAWWNSGSGEFQFKLQYICWRWFGWRICKRIFNSRRRAYVRRNGMRMRLRSNLHETRFLPLAMACQFKRDASWRTFGNAFKLNLLVRQVSHILAFGL